MEEKHFWNENYIMRIATEIQKLLAKLILN